MKSHYRDDAPDKRLQKSLENDHMDLKYGFKRYKESTERIGWLINMHSVSFELENIYIL